MAPQSYYPAPVAGGTSRANPIMSHKIPGRGRNMSRSLTGTSPPARPARSRRGCSRRVGRRTRQQKACGGRGQEVVRRHFQSTVFYSFISVLGLTGPRRTKESAGAWGGRWYLPCRPRPPRRQETSLPEWSSGPWPHTASHTWGQSGRALWSHRPRQSPVHKTAASLLAQAWCTGPLLSTASSLPPFRSVPSSH